MPDRKTLEALLVRVEGATEFDRELDRDIGLAIGGWRMEEQPPHGQLLFVPEDETFYATDPGAMYPSLTDSIGAAIALVERLLPGWHWQIGTMTRGGVVNVQFAQPVNTIYGPAIGRRANVTAKTPPLAILAALLTAIMQTQDENV